MAPVGDFAVLAYIAVAVAWAGMVFAGRGRKAPRRQPAATEPLCSDDLRAALAQIADWVLLCDAHGTIQHVLAADIDALQPGESLRGKSLTSLLTTLGDEPETLLPPPGRACAVTLADFGVGLRKIVPVRLMVQRTSSDDPGKAFLVVASGREEEVVFEDAIRVLGSRMERLQHEYESMRRRILYLTEEEQVRIGRELHDGIGQQLAGIAFLSRSISDRMLSLKPGGEEQLQRDAEWVSQLAAKAMESCRHLSHELSSVEAHQGGLHAALVQLCHDAGAVYGAHCAVVEHKDPRRRLEHVPPALARHAYRVAQEALNNALRHGRARNVWIYLARSRTGFRLAVADDGAGFELRRGHNGGHSGLGLSSMRVRATLLGGHLRIRTRYRGTLVMLVAPMPNGEEVG